MLRLRVGYIVMKVKSKKCNTIGLQLGLLQTGNRECPIRQITADVIVSWCFHSWERGEREE